MDGVGTAERLRPASDREIDPSRAETVAPELAAEAETDRAHAHLDHPPEGSDAACPGKSSL